MTSRGKFILTLLILGVAVFGAYRWWDKLAPASKPNVVSLDPAKIKEALAGKGSDDAAVTSKLLLPGECEIVSCMGEIGGEGNVYVDVDPEDKIADCHPANNLGADAFDLCPG